MEATGEEEPPGGEESCKQCADVEDIFEMSSLVSQMIYLHADAISQMLDRAGADRDDVDSITLGSADLGKILDHLKAVMTANAKGLNHFRQQGCIAALGADELSQIDAEAKADAQEHVDRWMLKAAEMHGIQTDQRDTNEATGNAERLENTTRDANAATPQRPRTRLMAKSQQGSGGDETSVPSGEPDQNDHAPENAENQEANQEEGNGGSAGKTGKKGTKGTKGGRKGGKKQQSTSSDDDQHTEGGSGADDYATGQGEGAVEEDSTGEPGQRESDSEARFTLEHYNAIADNFDNSNNTMVVADTHLNGTIPQLIDGAFDSLDPDVGAIDSLARNYALVLAPLRKYAVLSKDEAERLAKKEKKQSEKLIKDALPAMSDESTLGALLCAIPEKAAKGMGGEESGGEEEIIEDESDLARLLRAIYSHDKDGRVGKASKQRLREVLTTGYHTRRIAKHLFHASLQQEAYRTLTVHDLFMYLEPPKKAALIASATSLAEARGQHFDEQTTVAEYVEKVILPALASENHRAAAAKVISNLYKFTTETKSDSRREIICGGYRKGELKRVDGSTSKTGVAYCSDTNDATHTTRRKVVCTTYWLFVIKAIMERLGLAAAHFPFGFTESILHLAPSDVGEKCTFLLSERVVGGSTSKADAAKLKNLTEYIEAEQNDGKRIVIIETDEQLECLRALAISG